MKIMLKLTFYALLARSRQRVETKRQATHTARLHAPGCLAMRTNKVKKCAMRKIIFCTGLTKAAKVGQNLLYRHDKPNEPTKEGPLSRVGTSNKFPDIMIAIAYWTKKKLSD
jgi:hypothetical protein